VETRVQLPWLHDEIAALDFRTSFDFVIKLLLVVVKVFEVQVPSVLLRFRELFKLKPHVLRIVRNGVVDPLCLEPMC
jgi:hypothetical protein